MKYFKQNKAFFPVFAILLVFCLFLLPAFADDTDDEDEDEDEPEEIEHIEKVLKAKEIPIVPVLPITVQDGRELKKLFSKNSPASGTDRLKLDDYYPDQVISTRYRLSKNGKSTTWFLMYTRSADIIDTLTSMYEDDISDGNIKIAHNPVTNAIIVRAKSDEDKDTVDEILDLISSLDIRSSQVLIDVLVVELTISDDDLFNMELKGIAKNIAGNGTTGVSAVDHGAIDLINPLSSANGLKAFISSQNKWQLFLNAYKRKNKANIISSPHIVAANHRKATFKIGEQVPLITSVRPSDAGPIKTFEVKEVGLELSVTPHINRSQQIDLEVFQTINNITSYNPSEGTAQMSNREVETNITLGDGETLILGGFIEQRERIEKRKTPVLSKIPLIGKLFTKNQKTVDKTELLVFLTPRLLESEEDRKRMIQYKTDKISQRDKVRQLLTNRRYRASRPRQEGIDTLIKKESRGWLYDFDTKQIEDIVWEVPPKIDPSTIKLMRYGSCPFAYGESKSLKAPFVRTLLRPSEGFVFYKEFNIDDPNAYKELILKVASANAAAIYLNGVLIDEDPMIKLKDGHDYEYWNRIREDVPLSLLLAGKNTITAFLGNDKSTSAGYFDMSFEGVRKAK